MTATQREGLSDAALALTQPVIDELLKDIARRIKDAGAITDTAEYQIYRAQALGESKQAIKAAVARQIKAQDKVIDSLFDYILDNSTPLTANGSLKQIAEGYAKMSRQKTAEQLKNLWADTPQGKVLPIQDAYAKALDFAFRQTVTGALDTETAIRRACAPLAKRGLRTIEQKSGRSVGIEYACRRYLMDQLGELDDEVQQVTHDELGCDGWEISAHLACAPDQEPDHGRQPYIYVGDYMEESPLGKAEWLMVAAELCNVRDKGAETFRGIAARYNALKTRIAGAARSPRPKVMLNTPYRDTWFMPSSRSFMVRLIEDAGGEYVYTKNDSDTSVAVDLEEAYLLASAADTWINVGPCNTLAELTAQNPKFADVPAVRNRQVFNNNRRQTPAGGSDFWESGVIRPDLVLHDLCAVFNPQAADTAELYYYKRLE